MIRRGFPVVMVREVAWAGIFMGDFDMRVGMNGMREASALLAGLAVVTVGLSGCAIGTGGKAARTGGAVAAVAGGELPRPVVERRVQEIGELERKRFAAQVAVDVGVLGELLSDRLRYCHSDGRCETKAQFVEALTGGRMRYRSIEVLELEPRVVGSAMVVHGKVAVAVESQGKPAQFQLVFTDVYESTVAGWRLVAWQSTRLP